MLLNNDIQKRNVQMILHFQKEINVIMYTIEKKFKFNFNHFIWTNCHTTTIILPLFNNMSNSTSSLQNCTNTSKSLVPIKPHVWWSIWDYKLQQHLENYVATCKVDEQSILLFDVEDIM